MKVIIDNKEVQLKYSFRALMIFEKIAGKTFSNITGLTEILIFMYSVIISSDKDVTITWDLFIDWLDENPNVLTEFTNWLNNVMIKNNYIVNSENTETVKEGDVDPKKE